MIIELFDFIFMSEFNGEMLQTEINNYLNGFNYDLFNFELK